jgi:hypothetical protein
VPGVSSHLSSRDEEITTSADCLDPVPFLDGAELLAKIADVNIDDPIEGA